MRQGFFHRLCSVILTLYFLSSLSPRYASVTDAGEQSVAFRPETEGTTVSQGILWLNIVSIIFLNEAGTDDGASDGSISSRPANDDIFFVKKRRAVYRERFNCTPLLAAEDTTAAQDSIRKPLSGFHAVPHDPIHDHVDGYYWRSTGLSPPALLS